jgi:DNA-directed RNA polymerase specialized sigma24 family protein
MSCDYYTFGTIGEGKWVRAVSEDSDAFGAIFDLHRDRVFGHSLRLVRSVPDAEDVTALVFLEA